MNVIEICGGIGNQLFQYAFGQVQKANGIDVNFNTKWYRHSQEPPRPYRLDKFCTDIKTSPFLNQRTIREGHEFDLNYLKEKNCNFKGYWQYLNYCKNILHILRKELHVREKYYTKEFLDLRKQIIENPSVSIHVRRTDYIKRIGFGVLPLSYYFKALRMVEGDIYIFSDDIQWCEDNFKEDYFLRKITFVHSEDYLDFELMRSCTHHILANSTFGWWASILDDDHKKIVVTPPGWLALDRMQVNGREGNLPEHWIKL